MATLSTSSGEKQEPPSHLETAAITHEAKHELIDNVTTYVEGADSTPESFAHLDIKKIHRKMDARIVPMLTALYLLSFLDRGNIGKYCFAPSTMASIGYNS